MSKAKKPNEIREEVRKQTAAKYKEEIERLKKLASDRWDNYMDATKRLADLHDENEQLKEKLANGVAHFIFIKKDGSVREAWGTTKSELAKKHINGRGESRENYCTTAWWDCENGGWKSLRWESIVKVF